MINGVSIPILTPYKFYPATDITTGGVNFQNVDNTALASQVWGGVYPNCFIQPVPRYWNDYSPGIDFELHLDENILSNLEVDIIDLEGNTVADLVRQNLIEITSDVYQVRFYANQLINVADGYYRLRIFETGGDDIYYSEIIELKETFDGCYPLEYSNFENDFGLIFTGTTETWVGKILLPMRMFAPIPSDERESYQDDNGVLTTLRSLPNRVYQMESYPVATWFAEKIKLIFNCSDLTLNKQSVNTNETPEIELVSESDLMTINSEIQLNDFPDDYFQDEKINTITELLTSWTESVTPGDEWDFTAVGKDITAGIFENSGTGTATSNSFSVVSGSWYLFKIILTGLITDFAVTIQGVSYAPVIGTSYFLHKATASASITAVISCEDASAFAATPSIKKIT